MHNQKEIERLKVTHHPQPTSDDVTTSPSEERISNLHPTWPVSVSPGSHNGLIAIVTVLFAIILLLLMLLIYFWKKYKNRDAVKRKLQAYVRIVK